ncbi:hypothetical protein ASPWEDRAFT_44898 [Aspergillus wentii DTO 134E9]|uniref:Phosphoglycolate phosphatase n=1 Tax=Aspergillus wentii DTO 134E9 TaxID=1073089 RepID=A0A1L9R7T7_ASPWE|nr:uncharacterized protein ASPWEDRAFT_44898 [Aspergillus wentii DTO 134E9]KAI9927572.1 Non-essential glycogen phosphorylase [Aspergillus wentii]OJJ30947.1 hypothetical protein ASPWEDRAFT_44898 [Aspergillus wentii DTO 134E9]
MFKLAIFDFDGTIFDSHDAITHAISQTFTTLSTHQPPESEIHRLISSGSDLRLTLTSLHPENASFDMNEWVTKYRQIYAETSATRSTAYPGAEDVLQFMQAQGIPMAIISNKDVTAVKVALERVDLLKYFPEALIVGDNVPGAEQKPSTASFINVLQPAMKKVYGGGYSVEGKDVLMVGDTVADIQFARNIGSQVCWCSYGQGNKAVCEKLEPDLTIDAFVDFIGLIRQLVV